MTEKPILSPPHNLWHVQAGLGRSPRVLLPGGKAHSFPRKNRDEGLELSLGLNGDKQIGGLSHSKSSGVLEDGWPWAEFILREDTKARLSNLFEGRGEAQKK